MTLRTFIRRAIDEPRPPTTFTVNDRAVEARRGRWSANYIALCPFHREQTPSLVIFPGERRFQCMGCGERGWAFQTVSSEASA